MSPMTRSMSVRVRKLVNGTTVLKGNNSQSGRPSELRNFMEPLANCYSQKQNNVSISFPAKNIEFFSAGLFYFLIRML